MSQSTIDTDSPWSPLRNRLFRALWIASAASSIGTWMQNIGGEWMMTTLAPTPLMVALMQTAGFLPTFLLALPAGALADIIDRRRLLLFAQTWMLLASATLALVTLLGVVTPLVLLLVTFAIGLGAAMNAPAWQAIVPELVSRRELPHAVSINTIAYNIARAIGPALGGAIIAATGPAAVFVLNTVSYIGVLTVLYRWRREREESVSPSERVVGAMRAGLRYVRHATELRSVLARAIAFSVSAAGVWALLALLARRELGLGAAGYGMLLGGLGAGAIAGAFVVPGLRRRFRPDRLVVAATILFAAVSVTVAHVRIVPVSVAAMVLGGLAWMTAYSTFNISVQTVVPDWIRARALSMYLLVTFGSLALGSALWGALAERVGIPMSLTVAAGTLLGSLVVAPFFRMPTGREMDLTPSQHWTEPTIVIEPDPEQGPVLVTVEYFVDPRDGEAFRDAMRAIERSLRRDGASGWGLFEDISHPGRYLETFLVESWAEHLRQHARVTNEDRAMHARAHAFHRGDAPPAVTHLIAQSPRRTQRWYHGVLRIPWQLPGDV
ncbi:MAG TPA: MFS transporter [Candidatus Kapabacteria bacterium]|nr:MFS transporter [Candidatus Kapabacteria bacterium]